MTTNVQIAHDFGSGLGLLILASSSMFVSIGTLHEFGLQSFLYLSFSTMPRLGSLPSCDDELH